SWRAAVRYSLKGVSSLQLGYLVYKTQQYGGGTPCGFGFPPERSWVGIEPNTISEDPVSQGREGPIFRERLLLTLSCVSGFHIIQTIFGCDLREDNTTWGFYQDSYDGRDFITFDKETMTWVAADIGAQITKRRWDAEVFDNQYWKRYREERCISWLRSSLEYGKEILDRSSHDGLTTLFCKVSGFYPRDITVTWLKNGESRQQDTYSEGILPSGDGTYQTWVTMEIDPKITAHYSCHVEHESLLEPLSVSWGKAFLSLQLS
uniref:Ig-like domain-containing protein n=1 Tax=Chelydra serpentina TaxID=8475 RepID=A0A8C3S6Z4_CHESE